jgi:hypothetical protein
VTRVPRDYQLPSANYHCGIRVALPAEPDSHPAERLINGQTEVKLGAWR